MKLGFCGTFSTGKTTLVNHLSTLEEFQDYKVSTERSKYLRDLGIPLNTDSTLKGQTIFMAERCSELIHDKLLTDRTIIDVMGFTECANSISIKHKNAFSEYASNFISEYDWIFYVSPAGVNIEDNGVRETNANYRILIDITIKNIIASNINKIQNIGIISGSTEERVKQIKYYLNM